MEDAAVDPAVAETTMDARSFGPTATAAQHDAAKHEVWERNYGRRASEDDVSYFFQTTIIVTLVGAM